jgi:hypothetical protein
MGAVERGLPAFGWWIEPAAVARRARAALCSASRWRASESWWVREG